MMKPWETYFDERQRKEIAYNRLYKDDFAHGTDGHNARIIMAIMADLLDMGLVPPKIEPPKSPVAPNRPKGFA